jgi:hypothetical protein
MECSGLAELGMARERVDGKIQSGVKPPQSKIQGSGRNSTPALAQACSGMGEALTPFAMLKICLWCF